MNVTLPEKDNIKNKQIIIYTIIAIVCAISMVIAICVQNNSKLNVTKMLGLEQQGRLGQKDEEQIENLKSEFNNVFSNSIQNDNGQYDNKKIEQEKEIVYTKYEKKESKVNSYDFEVHIPYINIESEVISKYNEDIEKIFLQIAKNVLQSENKNIIYTVEYQANIQDNILFVMIKSNFKQGSNAQKVIIQTYNYDLKDNKEITLADILKINNLDNQEVQRKINEEISAEQKKAQDLKSLGYNIYNRDYSNEMFKIENSTEFYFSEDTLYIIYAYGNESDTSEMDIVII